MHTVHLMQLALVKGIYIDEISYGIAISLVGDLQINEWQGNKKPQFMIQDIGVNEWQLL